MWEGVKNIFFGSIQFVWNFVQLTFFGRLLKGGLVFIKGFGNLFVSMLSGIRTVFSTVLRWIVDFVKNRLTSMWNTATSINKGIQSIFQATWNFIWGRIFKPIISGIVNFVRNSFTSMRDTTVNRITNLRDRALSIVTLLRDGTTRLFTNLKDNTLKRVLDMRTEAVRRFNVMKDRFFDVGRDIRDNLKNRFDDMVTAARELPGRIGDGIKNMASKATGGIKSFANSIGSTLETGVNKVVGGMNTLLSNIGVSLRVPKINIPAYATGTKDHPGGPAVVGEKGREMAHIPGQGYTMLGLKGAELLNLPKGSSVLPNRETERLLKDGMGLPGYETGVGRAFNWAKGAVKNGWQNMKNLASDAVGWLLDAPKKLFEKAMEFTGVSMPSANDFGGSIMRGSFTRLRDSVVEKLKGVQGEVSPGNPTFGPPFRMTSPFGPRRHPVTGVWRPHTGIDYAAPTGTPLHSQSAGTVNFSGWMGGYGNTVMVKSGMFEHLYAHNSRNLASVGQSVKKGQRIALVGSTGMSTGPHVHYEVRKNGTAINPKGFKTGGLIKEKMMALLGDGGWPEYVIPTDPARHTDAMKLLALAGRDIEKRGGAKRPSQLPNITGGSSNRYLEKIIDKLSEQVNDTKEIVLLLTQLLLKDPRIVMKDREIGKLIEPVITEIQNRKTGGKRRFE